MRYNFIILLVACCCLTSLGQKKIAFEIYNKKGKKVNYSKLLKTIKKNDIVLFGEYHNNPIAHWLQLELVKDLHKTNQLMLGAEMIEADNQDELNEYLSGAIDYPILDSLARLWPNYQTDYAPVVDFAKKEQITFIGTNIPRRFANMVYRNGGFDALDELTANEKEWVAPLPIPFDPELPQYKNILKMMGGHGSSDLVKAQAIKDATMAHFILKNFKSGFIFLHLNGAYHSDFYEGILWYLKQKNKNVNYVTITTVEQTKVHQLKEEHKNKADFIICVDEDMTKTY